MSDVIVKSLFRTVTENGHETIELLDSDDEMELTEVDTFEDKGMSSDGVTMVGDFDIEMDSDGDNEEPHLFHGSVTIFFLSSFHRTFRLTMLFLHLSD